MQHTARTTHGHARGVAVSNCTRPIVSFRGLPFARARRFDAPIEPEPWRGIRDASELGLFALLGL